MIYATASVATAGTYTETRDPSSLVIDRATEQVQHAASRILGLFGGEPPRPESKVSAVGPESSARASVLDRSLDDLHAAITALEAQSRRLLNV